MAWNTRSLPTTPLGAPAIHRFQNEVSGGRPTITAMVGVKEKLYDVPRPGQIKKKVELWGTSYTDVTVIGEYGALYEYSDGIERYSENGKFFIVQNGAGKYKVPAKDIIFPCNQ